MGEPEGVGALNRVENVSGAGSSRVADETEEQGRHRDLPGWREGVELAVAAGRLGGSGAAGRVADAARALPARMAQAQLRAGTRDASRLALEAERALLQFDSLLEIGLLERELPGEAVLELRAQVDRLLDLLQGRSMPPAAVAEPSLSPISSSPEAIASTAEDFPAPEPPRSPVQFAEPTTPPAPAPVVPDATPVEATLAVPTPPTLAPPPPARTAPPAPPPLAKDPASLFSTPHRPKPPVERLVIDGCNFLGRARGFDLGNVESRDRLLFRLQEYARKHPAHRILVFFDGQHASRKFTAGIEERVISADRTADDGIIEFLKNLSPTDRPRATLVTDDRELVRRALAEGARRESVAWLAERISRKNTAAASSPVRREGGLNRNELEDWEQFFSQPPDRPGKG